MQASDIFASASMFTSPRGSQIDLSTMTPIFEHEKTMKVASTKCTCRGYHNTKGVFWRPVFLTHVTYRAHAHSCPFWSAEELKTSISFGLILCYLAIGIKWRLLLALSIGTRPFSVVPSLKCHRAVNLSSSPAFSAVAAVIGANMDEATVPTLFTDLRKIFDTRRASRDDRLPDGQTLLHVSNLH